MRSTDDLDITSIRDFAGLTADSRKVRPGYIFIAIPGTAVDGRDYLEAAIAAGATAVVVPKGTPEQSVPTYYSKNIRSDTAKLAARFYLSYPPLAAVTGTNGKTSVADFALQIWTMQGVKAFSIGTLGVRGADDVELEGSATTPDPIALRKALAELSEQGYECGIIEASSHGLDQHRMDGLQFKTAGFTSFSQDHLDYHESMDAYFQAKMTLFNTDLLSRGTAYGNADMDRAEAFFDGCSVSYGYGRKGEFCKIEEIAFKPDGMRVRVLINLNALPEHYDDTDEYYEDDKKRFEFDLPLIGEFQAYNVLCACFLAMDTFGNKGFEEIVKVLPQLKGVPGRMQLAGTTLTGAGVYVDYAHTPDALETVLKALRPHTTGRLVCVFGCGGDRDQGKRPQMGKIASDLADSVYITDDNPRSEDPAVIRAQILEAAPGAKEIPERATAIRTAIESLERGDVLVIAGKGHEQGQIIGDQTHPFCDLTQAQESLKTLGETVS